MLHAFIRPLVVVALLASLSPSTIAAWRTLNDEFDAPARVVLVAAPALAAPTPSNGPFGGVFRAHSLNLPKAPEMCYSVLGGLCADQRVTLLGPNPKAIWYLVNVRSEHAVWVALTRRVWTAASGSDPWMTVLGIFFLGMLAIGFAELVLVVLWLRHRAARKADESASKGHYSLSDSDSSSDDERPWNWQDFEWQRERLEERHEQRRERFRENYGRDPGFIEGLFL